MFEPITFEEVTDVSDTGCVILSGVSFPDLKTNINELDDFLHQIFDLRKISEYVCGSIPNCPDGPVYVCALQEDQHVVDIRPISGNVRGNEARPDYAIFYSGTELFNVYLRWAMRMDPDGFDFIWPSDFTANYAKDYAAA